MQNNSGIIKTNHQNHFGGFVFDMYNEFNSEPFPDIIDSIDLYDWGDMIEMLYRKFEFKLPLIMKKEFDKTFEVSDNNKVVLGFSGGLDSVYQAIWLKEHGYEVILYHLKGINTYENSQASKQCPFIAEHLGMTYVESTITKKRGVQQWPENPLKNQLILSLMTDYCIDNDIKYVSLGDDFNLSLADSVTGVNVTDAREITQSFLRGLQRFVNIEFLQVEECSKLTRINKLIDYGLENFYYSCVQSGRFNQSLHKKAEEKYGVKLFNNNCGCYCRKCAMHNLLLHYGDVKFFPQEFIDKCWRTMWDNSYSADYELFKPELSLDQRIHNLFTY